GEGLVRIFARRGTVVAPVDVRDLTHVSEVRTDLEALGAKLAAQRADSADRSRARELLDEIGAAPLTALSATPGPEPVRSLIRLDQRVHHCVHRATHNRYLQETLSQYLTLSLRLWFLGLERVRRLEEAITEHRDVLTAVLDGDGEAAEQAARSHVSGFWQEMRRGLTAGDRPQPGWSGRSARQPATGNRPRAMRDARGHSAPLPDGARVRRAEDTRRGGARLLRSAHEQRCPDPHPRGIGPPRHGPHRHRSRPPRAQLPRLDRRGPAVAPHRSP